MVSTSLFQLASPLRIAFFFGVFAALIVGCDDEDSAPPTGDGESFQVELVAPGVAAPLRLRSVLEIRGDTTIAGPFYSLDGRETWQFLPEFPIFAWQWVSDTSGVYPRTDGTLVFLDLETGQRVTHTPHVGASWLIVDDRLVTLVEETVNEGDPDGPGVRPRLWTIAVDGSESTWTSFSLPVMPTTTRTYLPSLHHSQNGEIYVVGRYGMYRGLPGQEESWEFNPLVPEGGFLSWSDNPVWVSRGGTIVVSNYMSFDDGATWQRRDENDAPWEHQDVNGDLYIGGLISTDDGQTWEPTMGPELLERLNLIVSVNSGTVRGRPGETHIQIGEYMYLVVTDDGRVESLVPHVAGSRDSNARNAADIIQLLDGRLLGHDSGQLLRYTPGDLHWEWLSAIPPRTALQQLQDGRIVMFLDNGTAGGAIQFSDDMGETWTEARQAPLLDAIFEFEDEWVGIKRGSCGMLYYTSTDEFLTWERREGFASIIGTDGEPVEAPFEFEASVQLSDGTLVGNAIGFQITLNGDCQVTMGQPARSNDRGISGVRMSSDDTFRARVVAANSRGGIAAIENEGQREAVYLYRGGSWIRVGAAYFGDRELRLLGEVNGARLTSYIDSDDHLVIPTEEGLVRTLTPFR